MRKDDLIDVVWAALDNVNDGNVSLHVFAKAVVNELIAGGYLKVEECIAKP